MIRKLLVCLALLVTGTIYWAGIPKYDIARAGIGDEGSLLVKVWIYGNNITDTQFKLAAVHGLVFRGLEGDTRHPAQQAMATPSAEVDNESFCKEFFSTEGKCQDYASVITGSYERVKTGKSFKYGAIVQVNTRELRICLENNGLVHAL